MSAAPLDRSDLPLDPTRLDPSSARRVLEAVVDRAVLEGRRLSPETLDRVQRALRRQPDLPREWQAWFGLCEQHPGDPSVASFRDLLDESYRA